MSQYLFEPLSLSVVSFVPLISATLSVLLSRGSFSREQREIVRVAMAEEGSRLSNFLFIL